MKFGTADASNNPSAREVTGADNAITLPTGIISIDQNAFANTAATTVDLSKITAAGFTTINDSVFQNMTKLETVTLPSGLTTINQSAFQNDAALKKLSTAEASGGGSVQVRANEEATTATFGKSLTTIQQNAFQGTGFTIVDLSKATGTPASGSPGATTPATTLSVGSNAFTNMANLTTVKLPKDSNINPAYFGTTTSATQSWTIQYGGDTKATATFKGDGSTFSGTNYNKISNETIDLTGYTNLTTLGAGVLFDNTAMTTLKMNAPIMSLSGANVSVADPVWQLGTVPTATNTAAAYATAALGGNSALTTIEFSGFKYKKTDGGTAIAPVTSFTNIDSDTWTQVSKLMNMFAKYATDQSVTNLTQWAVSTGEGGSTSNGVIQADIVDGKLNAQEDQGVKWNTVTGGSSETQKIVTDGTTLATLKHNGVTWSYSKDASTSEITITGEGINIYKAKNGTTGYQTYFATPSCRNILNKWIYVTINLIFKYKI